MLTTLPILLAAILMHIRALCPNTFMTNMVLISRLVALPVVNVMKGKK